MLPSLTALGQSGDRSTLSSQATSQRSAVTGDPTGRTSETFETFDLLIASCFTTAQLAAAALTAPPYDLVGYFGSPRICIVFLLPRPRAPTSRRRAQSSFQSCLHLPWMPQLSQYAMAMSCANAGDLPWMARLFQVARSGSLDLHRRRMIWSSSTQMPLTLLAAMRAVMRAAMLTRTLASLTPIASLIWMMKKATRPRKQLHAQSLEGSGALRALRLMLSRSSQASRN